MEGGGWALLARWLGFAAVVALALGVWAGVLRRLSPGGRARAFRVLLLALLYGAVAATATSLFHGHWGFHGDHAGRGLDALVEHRGEKPFVYRVLTPALVGALADAMAAFSSAEQDEARAEASPLRRQGPRDGRWDAEKARRTHAAYLVMFAALLAALVAARALTRSALDVSPATADFAPALAGLLLPLTFLRSGYLYDFPELAFVFGCAAAAAGGRVALFYGLFVLACLNKESNALLFTVFAAFGLDRMPLRTLLRHVAAQIALGAAIVVGLRVAFADAPGSPTWFFLPANLLWLFNARPWFRFFEAYGPLVPFPRSINLMLVFGLGYALLRRWSAKPPAVRRLLVYPAVPLLPLYALFGFTDEVRALAPLLPGVYLVGLHTVQGLYRPGGELADG